MKECKKLMRILQGTMFIIFSLQMILALQKYNAAPTMVTEGSKHIFSLEKPFLLTICKTSQFDYARSPMMGYNSSTPFLTGEHNNGTFLSWTGTGNMSFNETLNYLYHSGAAVGDVHTDNVETATRFLLPYGLCTVARGNLIKLLSKEVLSFSLFLKKSGKYVVFITDLAGVLNFQLQRPLTTGDSISIEIPANHTLRKQAKYIISLTERQVDTDDGSCTNYPDQAGHTSYQHCVEEENRMKILPVLGCMVPWMTEKDQCNGVLKRLPEHEDLLKWIKFVYHYTFSGNYFKANTCLLPCNLVSAHVNYLEEIEDTSSGDHRISLYFQEIVKVETVILAYGMDSLLVEIGSCLGLWLGLSVLGLFEVLLPMILRIKQVGAG